MTYKGDHIRWTQIHGFPKQKYGFKFHLKNVGNFVTTEALTKVERKKFKDAAYQWAWQHGYTVSVTTRKVADDGWECTATLVSKVRKRDFG